MKGCLITLEGGEGAGKSTVLEALRVHIESAGVELLVTREPGGTALGEAIRTVVLDDRIGQVCAESELLLMFASRAQLVREVLAPALERGAWILSDRFTDASFAYQGGGRGQPAQRIAELEHWAADGMRPDLTLLFDVPVAVGLARARTRGTPDRIEREKAEFFDRVRSTYRERARLEPSRFHIIDSRQDIESVTANACAVISTFMAGKRSSA